RLFNMKWVLLVAALLVVAFETPAHACKCEMPPLAEAFARADAVFVGRGVTIREDPAMIALEVGRAVKGAAAGSRIVITRRELAMMCRVEFTTGKEYLVFARKLNGALDVELCSRTRLLSDAAADVATLER